MTVGDVAPLVRDYARNQNLTDARVIRAVDSACDYIFSELGLPTQEREYSFNFFESEAFYAVPSDWGEPISLRYNDDTMNKGQRFRYRLGEFLYDRIKTVQMSSRLWGMYDVNNTLIVLAKNSIPLIVLDTMDDNDDTNWTASDDAANISTDLVVFKEGSGSLKFDITVALSGTNRGTLTRTNVLFDFTTMNNLGHAKCWVYIPNITNFSSVSFNWGSDSGNYFKTTVTTQEDGTAFVVGWNKLDFAWSAATQVGTPVITAIAYLALNFNYTGAYVDTPSFRVDYLRMENPDVMVATYYSLNKGTNSTGTALSTFTATTDIFSFTDTKLKQLVAVMAAILINPTILVDNKEVRKFYDDFQKSFKRRYPKKRSNNLLSDAPIIRTAQP